MTHRQSKQTGSAAIELALLLPMLILMFDGMAEISVLIRNHSVLISGSSLAARAGSTGGSNKLTNAQVTQLAQDYCTAHLMLVAPNTPITTTVTQSADPNFQMPIKVTVQYSYQGILLGGYLSSFQFQPLIYASAVMYNE